MDKSELYKLFNEVITMQMTKQYAGGVTIAHSAITGTATSAGGVPGFVKVVATEDEDGATVTVRVQPFNV